MFEQWIIFLMGICTAFLFSCKKDVRKWGYLCMLVAQPCWLIITFNAQQWGMFYLSVFYSLMAIRGFLNTWIPQYNSSVLFNYFLRILK